MNREPIGMIGHVGEENQSVLRVLVVDDDPRVNSAVTRSLRMNGLQVVSVMDGAAAVAAAGSSRFDVILLDLWMPGMNGREAMESIRKLDPYVAIVAMSAMGTESTRESLLKAGAKEFMEKPFRQDELEQAVENAGASTRIARWSTTERTIIRGRILLADDHTLFRKALARKLHLEGFAVTEVSNGLEAIEAWRTEKHDLALLDVHMPGLTGIDAAAGIRASDQDAAIIFMTGEAGREEIAETLRYAQGGCLRKPIETDVVSRTLDMLIHFGRESRKRRAEERAWREIPLYRKWGIHMAREIRKFHQTGQTRTMAMAMAYSILFGWLSFTTLDAMQTTWARGQQQLKGLPTVGTMYQEITGYLRRDEEREVGRRD